MAKKDDAVISHEKPPVDEIVEPPADVSNEDEDWDNVEWDENVLVMLGIEEEGEPLNVPVGELHAYGYGYMNTDPKAYRGYKILDPDGNVLDCVLK